MPEDNSEDKNIQSQTSSPDTSSDSSPNKEQMQPSIRDTFGFILGRVFERGQKELTKVAQESKERLLIRSLRKDRLKLYEKIGREVEQLILTGDIQHPGLEQRIITIREIEQEIEEVEKRIASNTDSNT